MVKTILIPASISFLAAVAMTHLERAVSSPSPVSMEARAATADAP